MSLRGKLGAVGGVLAALASLTSIIGWLFDYGHRTEHVVFGWVDHWGYATGSKPWILWCGLALAIVGLSLAVAAAWDDGVGNGLLVPFGLAVFIGLCSMILVAPSWHIMTWLGFGEMWAVILISASFGAVVGAMFHEGSPQHSKWPAANPEPTDPWRSWYEDQRRKHGPGD